jgi:hypothetical protein
MIDNAVAREKRRETMTEYINKMAIFPLAEPEEPSKNGNELNVARWSLYGKVKKRLDAAAQSDGGLKMDDELSELELCRLGDLFLSHRIFSVIDSLIQAGDMGQNGSKRGELEKLARVMRLWPRRADQALAQARSTGVVAKGLSDALGISGHL